MSKIITSAVLALSVLAGIASAHAAPVYGNGLAMAAANGTLTPHGVFDGR